MAQTMVNYAEEQDHNGYFDPKDEIDARHRVATEIVRRRGQPQFRQKLLKAYQKKCAISSTSVEQTLEAAHILPYMGDHTNHITNGLLLRSDLHTLFDLGLIAINPDSMHVVISPDLIDTVYGEFSGKHLRLPEDEKDRPDREGLSRHRRNSGL
jgi:predicted restriction endonuclease